MIGFGNIQPAVLERKDGSLVAYMRENGSLDKIRVCESKDEGLTWGPVGALDLPNPGSGLDAVRLANGHWVLIYNDTTKGRNSLAVSLSEDEGKTWKHDPASGKARKGLVPLSGDHPGGRRHDPRRLQLLRRGRQEHEARRVQRRLDPCRRPEVRRPRSADDLTG